MDLNCLNLSRKKEKCVIVSKMWEQTRRWTYLVYCVDLERMNCQLIYVFYILSLGLQAKFKGVLHLMTRVCTGSYPGHTQVIPGHTRV